MIKDLFETRGNVKGESYTDYVLKKLEKDKTLIVTKKEKGKITYKMYKEDIVFEYNDTFDTFKVTSLTTKKSIEGNADNKTKKQYLDAVLLAFENVYSNKLKLYGRAFIDGALGVYP